jgi:hypothetical protein
MARKLLPLFGIALSCAALACGLVPTSQEMGAAELPPLPAGQVRIILYMAVATELPGYCPILTVDNESVGKLCVGTFFSFDRSPGAHQVGVGIDKTLSAFGEQDTPTPVELTLGAGETGYVQVLTLAMSQMAKVVLTQEATANGERDISSLRFANPPPVQR